MGSRINFLCMETLKYIIIFSLVVFLTNPALADSVQIPIECACRDQKIEMYGGKEENTLFGTKDTCYVLVEIGKSRE